MSKITPLQGDQIALPVEVEQPRKRFWLQIERDGNIYTYDEFKKSFELCSWDAKNYPTLGRARTARYALRTNKQLKKEFAGCQVVIYDADLQKVVDPFPPEPKPLTPITDCFPQCDNADRLPWCPECGALLLRPYTVCESCEWEDSSPHPSSSIPHPSSSIPHPLPPTPHTPHPTPSPPIAALKQRCTQLLHQIDAISRSGGVAPKGCSIEPYYVTKRLADGKKERFRYYRVKSEGEALFQSKGQPTKSLHLGTETSAVYQDWKERVKRRNALKLLHSRLDKAERRLQQLSSREKENCRTPATH